MCRRRHSFILRVLLVSSLALVLVATPLLDGTITAGIGQENLTPANPDGPPLDIPPLNTVAPPQTPALTPANPDGPGPNIPPIATSAPELTPIFPVETDEPPTAEPPTTAPPTVAMSPGNLTIYSRICDNQGFNPYVNTSVAEFEAECPAADREFTFTLANLTSGFEKTVTSVGGMVKEVVPAPGVAIVRAADPAYDLSLFTCWSDLRPKGWVIQVSITNFADVAPGENVECFWFSVLASTDVNLTLYGVPCIVTPALATPTTMPSLIELGAACPGIPLSGLAFTVADSDPATADVTVTTAADPGRHAQADFLDLKPGTYTMTLTPRAGATHAYAAACGRGGPSGPFTTVSVVATGSGFTFSVNLDVPGITYACTWYIVQP